MEKIACFFCDILGTLNGSLPNESINYYEFHHLLVSLKEKLDVDVLLFSLVSSEIEQVVFQNNVLLKSYFGDSVVFGKQFFDEGYIDNKKIVKTSELNGKAAKMVQYVNELNRNYEVKQIFLADDSSTEHEFLEMFAEVNGWKISIHSLLPTKRKGLVELNALLQDKMLKIDNVISR